MIVKTPTKRAVRLHTILIPATRLAGLGVVCALIPLHNAAVLGSPHWRSMGAFGLASALYCLGSWLVLKAFFVRYPGFPWEDVFLVADIFVILFAVGLTGGTASWLFLVLAGRCVDQLAGGFKRTVWFNHLTVGFYALYLLVIATRDGDIPWMTLAAKLSLLYAINWYCSFTARTVDSIRSRARRAELAKRTEAENTAAVAHAIRTSADALTVLTELLVRTSHDSRQEPCLQGLAEHCQNILETLPLLDPGAVSAGPATLREAAFSPHALIEESASLLRPLAQSKGLEFRIKIGAETPLSMTGDVAKIRQVLLSLMHNAVRFTETGSVELRCWRNWPDHVVFEVKDSGPGIPASAARRICEDFFRADGTAWHRYHGGQIGLSVSKRLVDLMGGRLAFHSEPLGGTTVRVELPRLGTRSFFLASPSLTRPPRPGIEPDDEKSKVSGLILS